MRRKRMLVNNFPATPSKSEIGEGNLLFIGRI